MKRSRTPFLAIGGFLLVALSAIAMAADSAEEAIKKEQKRYEGTWKVVSLEVDGNKSEEEDAKKISVVNGADGTWTLRVDGKDATKGTSTIDPSKKPKTIDLLPTEGDDKDKVFLGIYEIEENTRKLCLAPTGMARPTEFTSKSGTQHILVTFEREKPK